jgi:hypothetical protein
MLVRDTNQCHSQITSETSALNLTPHTSSPKP